MITCARRDEGYDATFIETCLVTLGFPSLMLIIVGLNTVRPAMGRWLKKNKD
jgi:hypothetical protein